MSVGERTAGDSRPYLRRRSLRGGMGMVNWWLAVGRGLGKVAG